MTASEYLRELDAAMTPQMPNRWIAHEVSGDFRVRVLAPTGVWFDVPYDSDDAEGIATLRNALPLLADVIEAAEFLRDQDPDHRAGGPLDAALAALRHEVEGRL